MYYGNIKKTDIADGDGVRVSLFVSGCRNCCKGCFQPKTWDFKYGMEFTKAHKNETPDQNLINRHWHDIFPLMKKRYIFANVENFLFYDVWETAA